MQTFYVAVMDYDILSILVRVCAEEVPWVGEEVEVNFDDPNTEVIALDSGDEGPIEAWGAGELTGSFSYTVTGNAMWVNNWKGLSVVECQLAYSFP